MCCEWTQPTAEAGCQEHGAHRWGLSWGGRRGGPQHGTKLFSLDHLFIQQAPGETLEIISPLGQKIAHTRIGLVYDARHFLIDLASRLLAVFLRGRQATVEKHRTTLGFEGQGPKLGAHPILDYHATGYVRRPSQIIMSAGGNLIEHEL